MAGGEKAGKRGMGFWTCSALVIGKYLSPRFYLEYTTSLFEEASVLSIRYKLNRYLKLQAESSDKRQAIDLIYEIEH